MHNSSHNENDSIVTLEGVSFSYGDRQILRDISLDIHRGDYLGIVGSNGTGKTTLLKIILGLLTPETGVVKLFDTTTFKNDGRLGYIPQNATNIDTFFPATASDIVRMGIRKHENDANRINKALEAVDMQAHKDTFIRKLSGGQQQRVFIARALVNEPEILILDEPTVGISREVRDDFFTLLRKLNEEHRITVVLITHDIEHAAHDALHVACIVDGKICYHRTAHALMQNVHTHEA